jgi:hypothetical protein
VKYAECNNKAVAEKQENKDRGYPFRHGRSVMKLELTNEKEKYYFKVTTVPYEFGADGDFSTLYRIWGVDDYVSATSLKINYIPNTKIIESIHFATKDKVGETITSFGNLAVSLIPLLVTTPILAFDPVKFEPTVMDPEMMKVDQWMSDPVNKDFCVKLRNVHSESSSTLKNYVTTGGGNAQTTFPVPACSAGVVDIAPCSSRNVILASIPVKYVGADKIIPVDLPLNGKLQMDPICGAQVNPDVSQDQTRKAYQDNMKTIYDQIQAIKDKSQLR